MVATDELPGSLQLHAGGSSAVQPGTALHLVLVHDRSRVRPCQPVLVGKPRRPFGMPHERWTRFQAVEPLSEIAAGDPRDAGYEVFVHLGRVDQSQGAPPCRDETPESSLHYRRLAGKT